MNGTIIEYSEGHYSNAGGLSSGWQHTPRMMALGVNSAGI